MLSCVWEKVNHRCKHFWHYHRLCNSIKIISKLLERSKHYDVFKKQISISCLREQKRAMGLVVIIFQDVVVVIQKIYEKYEELNDKIIKQCFEK